MKSQDTYTARSPRRWRRHAGIALAVGFAAASVVATGTASASSEPDQEVGTGASVGGTATPPTIECAWALNDASAYPHDWNDGMQYGLDDDPDTYPAPEFPCDENAAGSSAEQVDGATNMIQVLPNPHDEPTEAYVELWAAVTSNAPSSTSVYFDVYHPDGTFKVQIDGSKYADSANAAQCAGPAGMFQAAMDNHILTQEAVDVIQQECQNQQKTLWFGAFGISKHQPYGSYRIEAHSFVAGGDESVLTYYIDVLPFYQLEKDFVSIDFGPVGPNSHFWQPTQGDFAWDGTDDAVNQASTVRNVGNAGIGLSVRFASLCRDLNTSCTDDKRIDHFDVKFGTDINNLQSMGNTSLATALTSDLASSAKPAPPGAWYPFDDTEYRVLCPNDTGKIEFSIWTEGIPSGTYSAPNGIGLLARPIPTCDTDLGSVYLANGYSGATPTSNTHWAVIP